MSSEVSEEDFQAILAQTRHFVRTAVVPREREILATDRVPDDLREQAKKMGLFGYAIPQRWGGLGLDLAQDVELAMEFGYTSLALRSMFGTNNGIAGQVVVGFGTDQQKTRWLEGIASGDVVASFALTEPEAGLDAAGSISMWEDPAEAIGAFAGKIKADLVIVGHHRRSALDRWWRGSVGHSLIDQLPCSLFVSMPREAANHSS